MQSAARERRGQGRKRNPVLRTSSGGGWVGLGLGERQWEAQKTVVYLLRPSLRGPFLPKVKWHGPPHPCYEAAGCRIRRWEPRSFQVVDGQISQEAEPGNQ